jgi:hypothetical protein
MLNNIFENPRKLLIVDLLLVVPFLILPLLLNLPYRVNIFLSWEGAYRLYLGQVPFKDFGLPMGFGYWLVPALFFKLFGPTMVSLVKAQVLINLVSVISLRGLLYNLKLKPFAITLTILIFCLTYVVYNFWPWYNHSVVVFELVALYFVTSYSPEAKNWRNLLNVGLAAFFTFISFFTKQDVGAICFFICLFLLGYSAWLDKKFMPVAVYVASFLFTAAIFVLPFLKYDFTYWFNLGQEPHSSRISIGLLLDILFSRSLLEKLYLVLILGGLIIHFQTWKEFFCDRFIFTSSVVAVALILQSLVTRATSPLPTDHMSYFHTFAFAGIAFVLPWQKWTKALIAPAFIVLILALSFSEGYWKYVSGFITKAESEPSLVSAQPWVSSNLPTLKKITLPQGTVAGIDRLLQLPVTQKADLKVLNMTELTSLAHELKYKPQTQQPLWYHLNIGIFQKEVDEFVKKVDEEFYDLVLFESVPSLNNFYPYDVRNKLLEKYDRVDSFIAPRKVEDSTIEVFVKRNPPTNL